MAHAPLPTIAPPPEHHRHPQHPNMTASSFIAHSAVHPQAATLSTAQPARLGASGTPTPTGAATPAYTDSPPHMDYQSPASTSYLPTPPLVPSHSHPAILSHHSVGPPSSLHSLNPSPIRVGDLSLSPRRGSEAYRGHASDDSRNSSGHLTDPVRHRSESVAMQLPPNDGRIGVEDPCAERSYTELKVLGDGSFGTVWLCDWHSPVKPDVLLSAMQCGAGARPEWVGKRLVALKRMKRVFDGGWNQARDLGELKSLRTIPPHPAVIPLYDAFISPRSRELYFVFECMEGNLYQLTKSRKGRPLAAGLIASCFHQMVSGLYHIHSHGYFHRDMKPENLLVTTTGLCDYLSAAALNEINSRIEAGMTDQIPLTSVHIQKDVQVIVKLADFGLARAINSEPPYTEYVSTRWYRAPEVLLRAPEYGAPVDMWALGTILAEMINLKPLFPGVSEIDQVYRICDTLGDPSDYGFDERGRSIGGGRWNSGIKLAKNVGFSFPKRKPVNCRALFPKDTPESLVDCIAGLLRYNPKHRLTSHHCMNHHYYRETLPHLQHVPPLPRIPFLQGQPRNGAPPVVSSRNPSPPHHAPVPLEAHLPRPPPTVEIQTPEHVSISSQPPSQHVLIRADSGPYAASPLVKQLRALDLPTDDLASYGQRDPSEEPQPAPYADARPASYADGRHPSVTSSTYHGSAHSSNPGYGHPAMSSSQLHHSVSHQIHGVNPHVVAYVQQQQQQAYERQPMRQATQSTPSLATRNDQMPPRLTSHSAMTLPNPSMQFQPPFPSQPHPHASHPSHHSPSSSTHSVDKISGTLAKKKKWGLSSVFGGGDKHHESNSALPIVDEQGFSSSGSGLKRTQSGHYADDRLAPMAALDPKMAKKIAEKEKRELQKAKREAALRAQQERARAVLQKQQLLHHNSGVMPEIEYFEDFNDKNSGSRNNNTLAASDGMGSLSNRSRSPTAFLRQHGSHPYGHDTYDGGRNKARKTTQDDDHSSIGRASSKSRSLLSIGTVDSDPGPLRYADPLIQRTPSHSASAYGQPRVGRSASSLVNHSTASLESQLASQLARHATVNSASESSLSLGHRSGHGIASQMHLEQPPDQHGSYGGRSNIPHSHGSMRRSSSSKLPSIGDWPENPQTHEINPMFRVPQQHPQHPAHHQGQQQHTRDHQMTLPPFSAIAHVADGHHHQNS